MNIPFGTILINNKSRKLISKIITSNKISCGKYVRLFEEKFAQIVGTKHAVALSSGTDADTLALAVLYDFGAERGDEVIVPALSFVATGNAVLHAGFKPVFVDIERNTLNIDCGKIEKAITKHTRAIMPVHLMGKPADMDTINSIAKKYNLYVIEDAAEAHGAFYKNKPVGTLADMAAFSLYVAHAVSTGEGGIVLTKRSDFAAILRSLRSHGRACKCKTCLLNAKNSYCKKRWAYGKDIRFISERIGYSAKMNELEAAIGLGSLSVYDKILSKRRHNLLLMREKIQRFVSLLTTIVEAPHEKIGPHAFPIIISKDASFSRDALANYLEKNGIGTRDLFSSMPTQCPGFSFLGYKVGDFPNAEFIGTHGLQVGVHQEITDKHIDYFIKTIKTFLAKTNQ